MEELKPCPFCGKPATLFHDTSSDYETHWSYSVECTDDENCNASISYIQTDEEAANRWNTRKGCAQEGKMSDSLADRAEIIIHYPASYTKEDKKILLCGIRTLEAENAELHQKIVQEAWSDWTKYESWKIQELKAQIEQAKARIKDLEKG